MITDFQYVLDCLLIVVAFLLFTWQLFDYHINYKSAVAFAILLLYFYLHIHGTIQPVSVLIFFILGFIFIILEIFLPSGIIGILGLVSIMYSMVKDNHVMLPIVISLIIALVLSIALFLYLYQYLNKDVKLLHIFILQDRATTVAGYVSHTKRYDLIGKEMITSTDLRPSGLAQYLGERIDVLSEGEFIAQNTLVRVIQVEGRKIIVRTIK